MGLVVLSIGINIVLLAAYYDGHGVPVCPSIAPKTDLPRSSTRFWTMSVRLLRMISSEESFEFAASRSSFAGIGSPKVIEGSTPALGRQLKGNFLPTGISWSNPVNHTGITVGRDFASMMILPLRTKGNTMSGGQLSDKRKTAHSPLEAS